MAKDGFMNSFWGTIAGIWVSIFVVFALGIISLISAIVSSSTSSSIEKHSVLYLNLSGEVTDRPVQGNIFEEIIAGDQGPKLALSEVVAALDAAATDKRFDGVYIDCNGAICGLANSNAIADAIKRFKESGKWVMAYGDNMSQGDYYMACNADSVYLNPIGAVNIHGFAATTPFFKGLMDKMGVEMQIVKVGTYKSAVEPFMLTGMSDASREQQVHYLGMMWDAAKQSMAEARGITAESIDSIANNFISMRSAEDCVNAKLVDKLVYRREIQQRICELVDEEDFDDVNLVTPSAYCADNKFPEPNDEKTVAVLYALGDIVDSGDEGIVGGKMVEYILDIADDDDIDALILRVNSGGGSAFASEQIWEALEQYKATTGNPFYVSMADVAASGGYYISCGADKIYADPLTLTGSIGVFGMIPNIEGTLKNHLGINMETVETNADANFPVLFQPMTEPQKMAMQGMVDRCYELFTSRVAAGRGMEIDAVKAIAEGRVWDGTTAFEIGLVDELGSLEDALAGMAQLLEVDIKDMEVKSYPNPEDELIQAILESAELSVEEKLAEAGIDAETLNIYRYISRMNNMSHLQCRMQPVEIR